MELRCTSRFQPSPSAAIEELKGEDTDMVCISDGQSDSKFPGFLDAHLHGTMSSHLTKPISSVKNGGWPSSLTTCKGWNANHMSINSV